MISSSYTWNDKAREEAFEAGWEGIRRATAFFHGKLKQELNVANPRSRKKRQRGVYTNTSRPGEPPHKRTGWLQRHVIFELDRKNLRSRVGLSVNAIYGLFLELGTRKMAARPWLMATLKKYWAEIRAQAENLTR